MSVCNNSLSISLSIYRRHFGVTNMNAHSSRSHVIVRLSIESRKVPTKPTNPLRYLSIDLYIELTIIYLI
jgi:hypothetical protein